MKAIFTMCGRPIAIGLLCLGSQVVGLARDRVQEEFHQTCPLAADGQVRLDNVNGKVHITTWDRPEVQVDAVKHGDKQADLDAVKIEIDSKPDRISIHTKYPSSTSVWKGWKSRGNSAVVDYEIKVPVQARLEDIQTVNGSLEVEAVHGKVHASTVNGRLVAKGLAADTHLESVNGAVEAVFENLEGVKSVSLKTVNGRVGVKLPTNADAEVSANTLNGRIRGDPGLTVKKNWPVGSELHGKLGKGNTRVTAETVNGAIYVRHSGSAQPVLAEEPE